MNFSVVSRDSRAASYKCVVRSTSSSQLDGRMDVDFDHAGVRRDAKRVQPRVPRRLVALEYDWL